jgi:hypothetical protein
MNYLQLGLPDIVSALETTAAETPRRFGALTADQLNWRPAADRWSVAQCLEHLLTANAQLLDSVERATGGEPPTLWQRVPGLPRLFGRLLITSQAPTGTRKFVAPAKARPAASVIAPDVVARFVAQQDEVAARARALDGRSADRLIMVSPFSLVITYSVLDGFRLIVAHQHRHLQQADAVTREPAFPKSRPAASQPRAVRTAAEWSTS